MYLTQLRLDPNSAQARRDLADPYDMHRTLVRAFVRDEAQVPPRFLWRLEPGGEWARPTVLVQSSSQAPDWSFLDRVRGYLSEAGPPETKSFDPNHLVRENGQCRFRLVANPTVTRDGKRHGLVGDDAQLAWLQRQGERAGFRVVAALVTAKEVMHCRKGGTRVSLLRVCFEGVLVVSDGTLLTQALAAGIGHGKAFGCGLLSMARSG